MVHRSQCGGGGGWWRRCMKEKNIEDPFFQHKINQINVEWILALVARGAAVFKQFDSP